MNKYILKRIGQCLCLCFSLTFLGCIEKSSDLTITNLDSIRLSQDKFNVSCDEGYLELDVISNVSWIVGEIPAGWCNVSPRAGQGNSRVVIHVSKNEMYDDRAVVFRFETLQGNSSASLQITQQRLGVLAVTDSNQEVGADGGEIEVELVQNVNYTVSYLNNDPEWISPKKSKSAITERLVFVISPNMSANKREGGIIFSEVDGSLADTLHVVQQGR